MFNTKRFFLAITLGLVCGLICFGLASNSPSVLPAAVAWQLIFSRILIGFAIGISVISKMHWSLHGILIGALFSIPLALSGLMAPDNPEFSKSTMFIMTIIMGIIYGFLIELVTSVLFKARIKTA